MTDDLPGVSGLAGTYEQVWWVCPLNAPHQLPVVDHEELQQRSRLQRGQQLCSIGCLCWIVFKLSVLTRRAPSDLQPVEESSDVNE